VTWESQEASEKGVTEVLRVSKVQKHLGASAFVAPMKIPAVLVANAADAGGVLYTYNISNEKGEVVKEGVLGKDLKAVAEIDDDESSSEESSSEEEDEEDDDNKKDDKKKQEESKKDDKKKAGRKQD
jgi:hypothetical protein